MTRYPRRRARPRLSRATQRRLRQGGYHRNRRAEERRKAARRPVNPNNH